MNHIVNMRRADMKPHRLRNTTVEASSLSPQLGGHVVDYISFYTVLPAF